MARFMLMSLGCGGFGLNYAIAKEVVSPALAGMAIALVNTSIFLGAAIIQPLFGWIMDLSWSSTLVDGVRLYGPDDYRHGFWLMLGCVAQAIGASLFAQETRCRNIALT